MPCLSTRSSKKSKKNSSSRHLASDVSSSNRVDDRTSLSSSSSFSYVPSAGSHSDTVLTDFHLTCHNPQPPPAPLPIPPPTNAPILDRHSTNSYNYQTQRGTTRSRSQTPTTTTRNQYPRSETSTSSITHSHSDIDTHHTINIDPNRYVLALADRLLDPNYRYNPYSTPVSGSDPSRPTIQLLANYIHSLLATSLGQTIPLQLIRDVANLLHEFLTIEQIQFPSQRRPPESSLITDHGLYAAHVQPLLHLFQSYSHDRQYLLQFRRNNPHARPDPLTIEIEQHHLKVLDDLCILLENQPRADRIVQPLHPRPDNFNNGYDDDYTDGPNGFNDFGHCHNTTSNVGANARQSHSWSSHRSYNNLFNVNFAGLDIDLSDEKSKDGTTTTSATEAAKESVANLSSNIASAFPSVTGGDPLIALAMLSTGQIITKLPRPRMSRRDARQEKKIAARRAKKQADLSEHQARTAAASGCSPPREIASPVETHSNLSYEAAVKLLLMQFEMGMSLEDINDRLSRARSVPRDSKSKSKLSDTERRRLHRAEKKQRPLYTSLNPLNANADPFTPAIDTDCHPVSGTPLSDSGEFQIPSASRPPAEPPPSAAPIAASVGSNSDAVGAQPCYAALDAFLTSPFDAERQTSHSANKLSDLLDDYCIDTLFQPPASTLFLHDSVAIPCSFQTPNSCLSLLIDAALVAHIKLPSGSKGKHLRHLYPRSRVQAVKSFLQGSYSVQTHSKLDRDIQKAAHVVDKKLFKKKVPLHYDPSTLLPASVDTFPSLPPPSRVDNLSPTAAFSSSNNQIYLGSRYAILDTGAAHHFLSPDVAVSNKRTEYRNMVNANGKVTLLKDVGDLTIQLQDSQGLEVNPLVISACSICPDSPISLLSVSRLIKQGADFRFKGIDDSYMRYHGLFFKLQSLNGLWVMDLTGINKASSISDDFFKMTDLSSSSRVTTPDSAVSPIYPADTPAYAVTADLWHKRCGHVNVNRLRQLHKNHRALGLHFPHESPHNRSCHCETCSLANNVTRSIKPQRTYHSEISRKGQLITADLVGPFPSTPEGHRYAISFTDEYTRFSTVYFMQKKSDTPTALNALIKYYAFMNIRITEIRTDQGGEFGGHHDRQTSITGTTTTPASEDMSQVFGSKFVAVCLANNIKHVLMPAHTPQLHGIAERWNRTVITMANSMLLEASISPVLWSSAVAHANLIRNMLPTKVLGDYSPYELFTGRLPRFDNLRVWGSYCYRKIPVKRKIPGLPVRNRLIYVGETPDRVGFRCFDPVNYKFTTEYDLIFDENSSIRRKQMFDYHDNRRKLAEKDNYSGIPLVAPDNTTDPDNTDPAVRNIYLPVPSADAHSHQSRSYDVDKDHHAEHGTARNDTSSPQLQTTCSKSVQFVEVLHPTSPVPSSKRKLRSGSPYRAERQIVHTDDSDSHLSTNIGLDSESRSLRKIHESPHTDHLLSNSIEPGIKSKKDPVAGRNNGTSSASTSSPTPVTAHSTVRASPLRSILKDTSDPITPNPVQKNHTVRSPTVVLSKHKDTGPITNLSKDETSEFCLLQNHSQRTAPLSDSNSEDTEILNHFQFDPLFCPIRRFPVGKLQTIAPHSARWLRLAREAAIPMVVRQINPKHVNSQSYHRYQLSKKASTVAQYYDILEGEGIKTGKITQDIQNDFALGYVMFPKNTHSPSASAESFAFTSLLMEHYSSDLDDHFIAALAGTTLQSSSSYSSSTSPPSSFHDVIQNLWIDDPAINQSDEAFQQQQYAAMTSVNSLLMPGLPEPTGYREAVHPDHPEREHWMAAIEREITTLEDRRTWTRINKSVLSERNKGKSKTERKRPVRCKFVFKKKFNKDGSVQYKARLVACGYTQVAGQDFSSDELYASVCSYSSMRFLMSLATQKNYLLFQTDIQGAYLEPDLKDEIYMEPPLSMCPEGTKNSDLLLKINKGLYGLKQSGWAWAQCFKDFLLHDTDYQMGFTAMTGEPNLYRKTFKLNGVDSEIYVGQYVDDCFIAASSQAALDWFLERMSKRYPVNPNSSGVVSMSSPGRLLSMHVYYDQSAGILYFNQEQAISKLADKLKLAHEEPIVTPQENPIRSLPFNPNVDLPKYDAPQDGVTITDYLSIIGSCLHIAQVSRPDCALAVGILSRHSHGPGKIHMDAARDLVSYMYNTRHWSIQYHRSFSKVANVPLIYEKDNFQSRTIEDRLQAGLPELQPNSPDLYCDADFAGCKITRRSTSGMVIMMNGGPITWQSRLQKLCAQSSAESEIYAVTDSIKEALHIKLLCEECHLRPQNIPLTVWEDNNACIQLGHNLRGSNAAKHFELRLRLLNEHINCGNIQFSRINTADQMADPFTKPLPRPAFEKFRSLMMVNRPPV